MISVRKVGSFVATGFATQAAAAVAGLLLVRWMSVADYAVYTVAITIVGAIRLLTRGGVQHGLAAALARVWPDRARAAEALGSAMRVRWLISAITMPPILIVSWFLLTRADASSAAIGAILAILALIWLADTQGSVIDQVLFFDGKAVRVQVLDAVISAARLVLIALLRISGAVSATTALLTSLFSVGARIPAIRKWIRGSLGETGAGPVPETTAAIRIVALRQIPVDLFVALQAQAAIFYLTQGGGGIELAAYGALARIAQILTPFSAVILAFFVPAFAEANDRVAARLLGYVGVGALPGLGLAGWAMVAPGTLLFFIGPAYADQAWPLIVCAGTVAVMSAVEVAASLVAHRGWNRWGWVRIAIGLVWCVVAPLFIAVDTAAGAYLFYCGFSIGTVVALVLELRTARRGGEIRLGRAAD